MSYFCKAVYEGYEHGLRHDVIGAVWPTTRMLSSAQSSKLLETADTTSTASSPAAWARGSTSVSRVSIILKTAGYVSLRRCHRRPTPLRSQRQGIRAYRQCRSCDRHRQPNTFADQPRNFSLDLVYSEACFSMLVNIDRKVVKCKHQFLSGPESRFRRACYLLLLRLDKC